MPNTIKTDMEFAICEGGGLDREDAYLTFQFKRERTYKRREGGLIEVSRYKRITCRRPEEIRRNE